MNILSGIYRPLDRFRAQPPMKPSVTESEFIKSQSNTKYSRTSPGSALLRMEWLNCGYRVSNRIELLPPKIRPFNSIQFNYDSFSNCILLENEIFFSSALFMGGSVLADWLDVAKCNSVDISLYLSHSLSLLFSKITVTSCLCYGKRLCTRIK